MPDATSSILLRSAEKCASRSVGRHPLLPINRSIAEPLIEQPTVMASGVSIVKSNIMRRTSYPIILWLRRGTLFPPTGLVMQIGCHADPDSLGFSASPFQRADGPGLVHR